MSSYDCNGSNTQKWQWNGGNALILDLNGVLMPVLILNVSIYFLGLCLVPLTTLTGANGVRMNIAMILWFTPPDTSSGVIKLSTANFCLDVTNRITTKDRKSVV